MSGFITAWSFLTEHRGADIFDVITMAYEEGRKDGKSEQLEKVVAELKNLLLDPVKEQTKSGPVQDPDKEEVPKIADVDESHGLAARPKRPKAGAHPKAGMMKEMAKSGASLAVIMEAAGCSEPTARKYMKEALDE